MEKRRSTYLVTGATGFIGKRLVDRLLARSGRVHVLVRPGSLERGRAALERWQQLAAGHGGELAVLCGDVTRPGLGLDAPLPDPLDHVFHLAADYRLGAAEAEARETNVEGTRRLIELLQDSGFAGVLHHVSSIAVAGDHRGTFTEAMLDEGQKHATAYLRTKFEAEKVVRAAEGLRCRVYRPGAVVGDSRTGTMDKLDGPYYVFPPIQALRRALPAWVPLGAPRHGSLNIVPVDFAAAALDHIAHQSGLDGKTFHLVDPDPPSTAEALDLFLEAAHAPRLRWMWRPGRNPFFSGVGEWLGALASVRFLLEQYCCEFEIPLEALDSFNPHARFDAANARAALAGSGIECPRLEDYAGKLWAYYEAHLDPRRRKAERRMAFFPGKRILITGASSGIGEALARKCGRLGAHVVLVARRQDQLEQIAADIRTSGGEATVLAADLSVAQDGERVVEQCLAGSGAPDILVLNAARSIRRPLAQSVGRFHDFERTMALNYFGAARLVMGFLPAMRERRSGHVLHSSTWGVLYPGPRYAAYLASKAALDTFLDSLAAELLDEGIHVTQIHLPWVRTAMVAPTEAVADTRMLSAEQAAEMLLDAMLEKPRTVGPAQAYWTALLRILTPGSTTRVLNLLYRLYPDQKGQHPELDPERGLLKQFVRGSPL